VGLPETLGEGDVGGAADAGGGADVVGGGGVVATYSSTCCPIGAFES
jgi:hypothetical protein